MTFQSRKKNVLAKHDKSKKGSIDEHIKDLIDTINKSENYYTTSSCSGRIVLLKLSDSGKKNEAEWIFTSHELVTAEQIFQSLREIPQEQVWLRYEPPIIHACCDSLESADKLLELARKCSFKKSGLFSVKTLSVEINSNDRIDSLIARNGKLLTSKEFLEETIREANVKMKECWRKIESLRKLITT